VCTVALIPARGGSKGLVGKNLSTLGGVSLIGRAISAAALVKEISEVVVSSDDDAILEEARLQGADVDRRAPDLARDDTPTLDVVRDYLERHPRIRTLVLLQPTSPLRIADDIRSCLAALRRAPTAVTVCPVDHPPAWTFELGEGGQLKPILGWDSLVTRRQAAKPAYRLNGAVYVAKAASLRAGGRLVDEHTVGVHMPLERSIDIDVEYDLERARTFIAASGDPLDVT
jgi:CMP-N,N'-diacetyllegionaminic acid synthase